MLRVIFTGILLCLAAIPASGASLTLYFYPSPASLNWNSPRKVFLTALESQILSDLSSKSHSIGHVDVKLECGGGTAGRTILTGMTSGKNYHPVQLLKAGYGLGVLFENFDGHLESDNEVNSNVEHGFKSGHMNFLKLLISEPTCARMAQYFDEFKARGYESRYGLPNRPRYGEGAGCSAFAMSFLDVGGLLSNEWQSAWSENLRAPETLIGGPLTSRKVSLPHFIFSKTSKRWATAAEPGMDLFFYEPNLMYRWVKTQSKTFVQKSRGIAVEGYTPVKIGRAKGLEKDLSYVPTPNDPIWKN